MKARNSNTSGCVTTIPSSCIPWSGPSLPALGIKTGDSITDVEWAIANKVLCIEKELDVTDLDISCLIEKANSKPEDRTFKDIFQLLYDNQCSLKELIDAANGGTPEMPAVNINLRCLKKFDDFGNEIAQDLNTALQSIVNQICTNTTDIAGLKTKTISLQDQIDNLDLTPVVTEPTVVTCLNPTAKPVSQAVSIIAQDACTYKTKVGSVTDIQSSIARQPEGLNDILGTEEGWILSPANFAQAYNNSQIVIANLLARIKLIEDNCCKVDCDSIKVGFDVVANEDGDAIFIKFTSKAGTKIPTGFVDTGSVLTITDSTDVSVEYPIEVANGASEGEFQITGLYLGDFLNININVKMSADGLTCEKCVSRRWMPNANCAYCEINVEGTDPTSVIIVTYEEII